MTLAEIFYGLGHFCNDFLFLPFEWIGNNVNYTFMAIGAFGFLFWMSKQAKFNKEAEGNSNQLK